MDHGTGTFGEFVRVSAKKLSPQLRRVFVLLALGCDDDAIGLVLHLKRSTVRHYLDRVKTTVGVESREDIPLRFIRELAPGLADDLRVFFDPRAFDRVERILTDRANAG
jgi:DNA-binding CsgD family transcriptional regulator